MEVKIDNKTYPCRPTLGAMLRFKQETGQEVTEINEGSLTDLVTFLWCCIISACKVDNVAFEYTLMDFADRVKPEEVASWAKRLNSAEGEGKEKKTK